MNRIVVLFGAPGLRLFSWICGCAPGGRAPDQPLLLVWSHLQKIADHQVGMVSRVTLEFSRENTFEDPSVANALEKPAGHSRARNNFRGIGHPPLGPGLAQPLSSQQEIWRGGVLVVSRITRRMALQAGRRGIRE